jgi:hypothetical protein
MIEAYTVLTQGQLAWRQNYTRIGFIGRKACTDFQYEMVKEAHHNVLNHLVLMEPFVDKHLEGIHATCYG